MSRLQISLIGWPPLLTKQEAPADRLVVDPTAGVTALDPAGAVVSIVTPERTDSIRAAFCKPGRFFASRDAARNWQTKQPGMEMLSVVGAYRASRSLSSALLEPDLRETSGRDAAQ
jgi:hypothetical protein